MRLDLHVPEGMKETLRRRQAVGSLPPWTLQTALAGLFGSFRRLNYARATTCFNITFGACFVPGSMFWCTAFNVVSSALQYLSSVETSQFSVESVVHVLDTHWLTECCHVIPCSKHVVWFWFRIIMQSYDAINCDCLCRFEQNTKLYVYIEVTALVLEIGCGDPLPISCSHWRNWSRFW